VIGIAEMSQHIKAMQAVEHENIVKLLRVYHSETHIMFHMEFGDSVSLSKRLALCEDNPVVLPISKARQIITQLGAAVTCLHAVSVAHRGVHLENFIITETEEEVNVKLANFESAVMAPKVCCQEPFGIVPFVAPEVWLQQKYNPYAVDVWSLGVVHLEVLCSVGVVERVLGLQALPVRCNLQTRRLLNQGASEKVHAFFEQPASLSVLLAEFTRPGLEALMPTAVDLLPRMLNVQDCDRLTASQVLQVLGQV
jgi:serine/threonine protein kinase